MPCRGWSSECSVSVSPKEWPAIGWLALGTVALPLARLGFLRLRIGPDGVERERYFGGFRMVAWEQVEHVDHDSSSPRFRTGGELRFVGGRRLVVRDWSASGVEQAISWWREATGGPPTGP